MKKAKELVSKLMDLYLEICVVFDFTLVILVWLLAKNLDIISFTLTDKANQLSILSNIIGTNVALAGFMLASLTIIITFKSNLKSKGINEAESPLELIFSSIHYPKIVNVFKKAIIELTVCFFILYAAWCSTDNFSIRTINRINMSAIIITALTVSRSLLILFMILKMDKPKKIEE